MWRLSLTKVFKCHNCGTEIEVPNILFKSLKKFAEIVSPDKKPNKSKDKMEQMRQGRTVVRSCVECGALSVLNIDTKKLFPIPKEAEEEIKKHSASKDMIDKFLQDIGLATERDEDDEVTDEIETEEDYLH